MNDLTERDVEEFAQSEIDRLGLNVKFVWDRSVERMGQARYDKRELGISRPLFHALKDRYEILDTVLHEVAHFVTRDTHGFRCAPHGSEWKQIASELGATPAACYSRKVVDYDRIDYKYTATCPNCDFTYNFHRYTHIWDRRGCPDCCVAYNNGKYDPAYQLHVTKNY